MSKQSTQRRLAQINGVAPEFITEAFTKQHYIAIAKILSQYDDVAKVGNALADLFERDNPQFRREQFLTAADIRVDMDGNPR